MVDLITLITSALPEDCRVATFRVHEAISRPYEVEVMVVVNEEDDDIDLSDGIGAKARLVLDRDDDTLPPFTFAGIVARLEHVHCSGGRSLIRVVIVPRLWLLGLSRHSRIFTKKTVPEIIEEILQDNSLTSDDYELQLSSYSKEEHVCQYQESDLDFLSRWMEREGIFYYFEHSEHGEKLVISDHRTYPDEPLGRPVRYFPQLGGDHSAGPSFRTFQARHASLPGLVKLKDYDYVRPNLDMSGQANVSSSGMAEVLMHGARFFTPNEGQRLAKIRAEEMLARQVVFHAAGTRTHIQSGHVFELDEHPKGSFNKKYLAASVRHYGNQAAGQEQWKHLMEVEHREVYFVEIEAISADVQFRPASQTPWPRIYGVEGAVIDGPADSEYAQIDDQGRYLVKFRFDESTLKRGNASTYLRMLQPHGGSIEGFHFPLRKATEVMVTFIGGDPDRPVISGVAPNTFTPSPVTSGNHTKNVIQTGGRNRLELEDKSGQQRVTLSTPYSNTYIRMGAPNDEHELIVKTDDNTNLDAGKNFDLLVGQNGGGSWSARIKDTWTTTVQDGIYELFVTAGTSTTEIKGDTWLHVVSGNYTIDVDANSMFTTVKGAEYKVSVTAGKTTIDTHGTTDIKSKGKLTLFTENSSDYIVANDMFHSIDGTLTEQVGGTHTLSTGARTDTITGNLTQNISGAFSQTTASSADFWTAAKNSRTLGAAYSLNIGAKAAFDLSASATMGLSAVVALSAGVKLEAKLSIGLSMTAACEIDVASFKFDQKGVKYDTAGCGIKSLGTAIQLAGICLWS